MQEFEPRLLMPGATGAPTHIAVSHDVAVLEEFNNPKRTAIIYVPSAPHPAQAFNALNAKRGAILNKQIDIAAHKPKDDEGLLSFLIQQNGEWLKPMPSGLMQTGRVDHILEVSQQQQALLKSFMRLTKAENINLKYLCQPFGPDSCFGAFIFHPHSPSDRYAHIDAGHTFIFADQPGTILVDQDGLDIVGASKLLLDSKGRKVPSISQAKLANRIWQAPDCSYVFLHGGRPTPECAPQYHFFPHAEQNIMRRKFIASAPVVR